MNTFPPEDISHSTNEPCPPSAFPVRGAGFEPGAVVLTVYCSAIMATFGHIILFCYICLMRLHNASYKMTRFRLCF